MKISPVSLEDLDLDSHHSIRLRIGVKEDAKHPGGINIFGRASATTTRTSCCADC